MRIKLPRSMPLERVMLISVAGLFAVGLADYATGSEIRLFPLYFLPVALVSWLASRRWAFGMAAASGIVWMLANLAAGKEYSTALIWAINVLTQISAFAVVVLLVGELRYRLNYEEGLSRTDNLTGLPNSRSFYELAERVLAQAHRSRRPITFAYLDLDNFKSVNDTLGHQKGDDLLRTVASIFTGITRHCDIVARMGGDEFALCLPDSAPEGSSVLLTRLCETTALKMRQNQWPVTVSVGGICFLKPPATVDACITQADRIMYTAKSKGKNQAHLEIHSA